MIEERIEELEKTVKRLQNALIWGRICVICGSKLGSSGKKLEDEIEQFNAKGLFCVNCSTQYKLTDEKDWIISHITFPGTEARDLNFPGWRKI